APSPRLHRVGKGPGLQRNGGLRRVPHPPVELPHRRLGRVRGDQDVREAAEPACDPGTRARSPHEERGAVDGGQGLPRTTGEIGRLRLAGGLSAWTSPGFSDLLAQALGGFATWMSRPPPLAFARSWPRLDATRNASCG